MLKTNHIKLLKYVAFLILFLLLTSDFIIRLKPNYEIPLASKNIIDTLHSQIHIMENQINMLEHNQGIFVMKINNYQTHIDSLTDITNINAFIFTNKYNKLNTQLNKKIDSLKIEYPLITIKE